MKSFIAVSGCLSTCLHFLSRGSLSGSTRFGHTIGSAHRCQSAWVQKLLLRVVPSVGLAGWLCSTAPLAAQNPPISNDPNFTPSSAPLSSGLSLPSGLAFRQADVLALTQFGANEVSLVDATSGAVTAFVTPPSASANEIAVRSSDGLVAVEALPQNALAGPIYFYTSNGALQGSISQGTPTGTGCLGGMAFDSNGNLFVAAGPMGEGGPGGCSSTGWNIYEFAGPMPWKSAGSSALIDGSLNGPVGGLVFSAAPPPSGSFYAVASTGDVYEITQCTDCEFMSLFVTTIAHIATTFDDSGNPHPGIVGVATDPFSGDLYISEFGGSNIDRIPAGGIPLESEQTPFIFASGFANTFGIVFDSDGNLYVNETNAGNVWKFKRSAFATPQQPFVPGQVNFFAFTNPNPAMADQIQTIMIPASANPNGVAFIQDVFVPTDPSTINTTVQNGTTGDTARFGGSPVPAGTTCVPAVSAGLDSLGTPNCLLVIQKCFDANHSPFDICPLAVPPSSPDLIEITFNFAGAPANSRFLIGFDNGDGQDITDVTVTDPLGAPKSLCSKTFLATSVASAFPDFSLTASPNVVNLLASGSDSSTVTVTSINSFASPVSLGLSDVPAGFTASLTSTSVTPPANSTASSVLSVGISQNAAISGLTTFVATLLQAGCINSPGVENALTSKLSAAQAAVDRGQIRTAVNVLKAFLNQVHAQLGKHIAASCTTAFPLIVTGTDPTGKSRLTFVKVTFSPATILTSLVTALITSLEASIATADPITGSEVNLSGVVAQNAMAGVFDSISIQQIASWASWPVRRYGPNPRKLTHVAAQQNLDVSESVIESARQDTRYLVPSWDQRTDSS